MAIKSNINGVLVARPGVYSTIVSGVQTPSPSLPYGNLCIVDTGFGAGYGGGSGINGHFNSGLNSIYTLSTPQDYAAFMKGGELWNFTKPLFTPYKKVSGVSTLYYIRACTTTPGTITLTLSNGSITLQVRDEGLIGNGVLDTASGNLIKGHALKLTAGVNNTSKFIFTFYLGSYKGFDSVNGVDYSLSPANSKPTVVVTSPEISTIQDFITWANSTNDFTSLYYISASTLYPLTPPTINTTNALNTGGTLVDGTYHYVVTALNANGETSSSSQTTAIISSSGANTGSVVLNWNAISGSTGYRVYRIDVTALTIKYFNVSGSSTTTFTDTTYSGGTLISQTPVTNTATTLGPLVSNDIATHAGYNLFSGGTETYGSQDYLDALAVLTNLDNNFFLSLEYGDNATSANNFGLLNFIQTSANFEKFLVVAGGYNKSTFTGSNSSILAAQTFDSDDVIVVHGGVKKKNFSTPGFKVYSQLYKAAMITGRLCGLAPQVPVTFKPLDIDGEVHALSSSEIETAIEAGVLTSNYDYELNSFVTGLDVNTLQNNDVLVNDDGTSYNIAIKRIVAYLNRLIVVAAKQKFFTNEDGPNRNTVSEEDISAWLEGFLKDQTASVLKDGLILKVVSIAVSFNGTAYNANYSFVPNTEISQIIFTGTILNG